MCAQRTLLYFVIRTLLQKHIRNPISDSCSSSSYSKFNPKKSPRYYKDLDFRVLAASDHKVPSAVDIVYAHVMRLQLAQQLPRRKLPQHQAACLGPAHCQGTPLQEPEDAELLLEGEP